MTEKEEKRREKEDSDGERERERERERKENTFRSKKPVKQVVVGYLIIFVS
jgi:hypothetical protein